MIANVSTAQYWSDEDIKALSHANDFRDLYIIASRIFSRMPEGGIGQVCGPIGTGGLGSVEANLKKFDDTIRALQQSGKIIFDQIPFEWPMQELKNKVLDSHTRILQDFYLPIFESGKISTLYFMKGWESSNGAKWEHEQAQRLGIAIVYLD